MMMTICCYVVETTETMEADSVSYTVYDVYLTFCYLGPKISYRLVIY